MDVCNVCKTGKYIWHIRTGVKTGYKPGCQNRGSFWACLGRSGWVWAGEAYFYRAITLVWGLSGQGLEQGWGPIPLEYWPGGWFWGSWEWPNPRGFSPIWGHFWGSSGVVFVRNIQRDFGRSRCENGRYMRYAWVASGIFGSIVHRCSIPYILYQMWHISGW